MHLGTHMIQRVGLWEWPGTWRSKVHLEYANTQKSVGRHYGMSGLSGGFGVSTRDKNQNATTERLSSDPHYRPLCRHVFVSKSGHRSEDGQEHVDQNEHSQECEAPEKHGSQHPAP